jgi:uncharacterized metal-binding protein YceD (DUF177 family)
MYTVRLTRVPENGILTQEDVRLSTADLGLSGHFDPVGVSTSWELTRMMGKVYGKIRAEGLMHLNCGRCLRDFTAPAKTEFAVLFEPRQRSTGRGRSGEAPEEDEADEDAGPTAVFFDGEELPLGEELRQELELAVPFNALCGENCRGLCPRCGANLNEGPCACSL